MNNAGTNSIVLYRLVQHAILNDAGWWKQATEKIVLYSVYFLETSTLDEIHEVVSDCCGFTMDISSVEQILHILIELGVVLERDKQYRVSEAKRLELHNREQSVLKSEETVRQHFEDLAESHNLGELKADLWGELESDIISPAISRMGARMYEFITSSPRSGQDYSEFQNQLLESYNKKSVYSFMISWTQKMMM